MSFASSDAAASTYPTLQQVQHTAQRLAGKVLETPVWRWQAGVIERSLSPDTEVWLKLELFQRSGSFKIRGALNCLAALDASALGRGVAAASAGNHAMAVAQAASAFGTHAKVAMPRNASPTRIAACQADGAEVQLTDTVHEAFALAQRWVEEEGRTMVHPFDGPRTAEGTATVGLELMRQVSGLDAVVVPVGGGGLCAGIAAVVKQIDPKVQVFGIEPYGADAMYQSFRAGAPTKLERVDTIADSLGAPYSLPYSFGVCRQFVDEIVRVWDEEMCRAMHHLYRDMKLVAEPAAAAATAALLGPLRSRLDGKKVALIVCGSNTDPARFADLVARGAVDDTAAPLTPSRR